MTCWRPAERSARARLIQNSGAEVAGYAFLIELAFLNGRQRLGSGKVFSLISYADEN